MTAPSTPELAAPLHSRDSKSAECDVVVIGAGAAGLAAARGLRARGFKVELIEAAARVGGRVWTETSTFGVPYDVGAHWLHNREANPFADYGVANGFDIYPAPEKELLFAGRAKARKKDRRACEKAVSAAQKAMSKAARAGKDVPAASVMPDLGEWQTTAEFLVGPYEIAKDVRDFSCKDWWSADDGTDFYCREGFGALVAHWARDVPVTLNTSARRIHWNGPGVRVETDHGSLRARAVVVTVSMNVLAAGAITFDPPLPARKEAAIAALELGHYNHVVLQFTENFFGIGPDGYFSYKIDKAVDGVPHGFAALVDASGSGLTYCDLGGEFARQLGAEGPQASIDFVLSELKAMFGACVERALIRHHFYDWSRDPLVQGAYSAAVPGGAAARKELRRPEGGSLWFAGEALSKRNWATVAGAAESGVRTARKIGRALSG